MGQRKRGGYKRSRSAEDEARIAEKRERRRERRERRERGEDQDFSSSSASGWMVVERGGELLIHEGLEPPPGYRACTGDDGQVFIAGKSAALQFKADLANRFKRANARKANGGQRRGHEPIPTDEPIFCVTKGSPREEVQFVVRRLDEEWPRGWYEIKKTRSLIQHVAEERAVHMEERRREKFQQAK